MNQEAEAEKDSCQESLVLQSGGKGERIYRWSFREKDLLSPGS